MLPSLVPTLVRIGLAATVLCFLVACEARTDRALYGEGDGGTTHLANGSRETIQVDCTLHLDRVEDGSWVESGEQTISACRLITLDPRAVNDQLFAPLDGALGFPIEDLLIDPISFPPISIQELDSLTLGPGDRVHSVFVAPSDPGRWRVRYSVGFGCSDAATKVSECPLEHPIVTPAFGVEEFCAPEECVEEQPFCGPVDFFDDPVLHAELAEAFIDPALQRQLVLRVGEPDILPFPIPLPFPVPTADCRRDLETQECRWVCDESTPTPPPHGY